MKKNKIIILNNSFPLETFLENELNSDIYNNDIVQIFPIKSNNANLNTKQGNIFIIHTDKKRFVFDVAKAFLKFFLDKNVYNEVKLLIAKKRFSLNHLLALLRFYIGAESKLYDIKRILSNTININEDNTLIYSYWMHQHAYIGIKLSKWICNSKCITRCHRYDLYEQAHPNNYIPFRKFILSQADYICPISQNGKNYLLKTYGDWFAEKIHVARLGTVIYGDLKPYSGEPDKLLRIMSCSSMTEVKRLDRLIAALACMRIAVEWTHFGDGDLHEQLQSQIKKLPDNISCKLMGARPNHEITEYYKTHDIDAFINTSESEGVPVSMMEAMSCGIPVIATNVGGVSEIVHDGINGFLIEGKAVSDELAKQLECFAKLSKRRIEELRNNARATWEDSYNAAKNYNLFFEFLKQQALLQED